MSSSFQIGFRHGRAHEQIERERVAELHRPFAGNPPELLTPTRCRVLKPFYVGGNVVQLGEVVTLPKHDAASLRAIGRVEIVE